MMCFVDKNLKTIVYLLFICLRTGLSVNNTTQRGANGIRQRTTLTVPKTRPNRFTQLLPNTTWKKANSICRSYGVQLMLVYEDDMINREILPMMNSQEFIWVSVKDYGLNCRNETDLDTNSTVKVCDSYVRVNMKPTADKLHYGLCVIPKGTRRLNDEVPLTWEDMNKKCAEEDGKLYKFSTLGEANTLLSIARPNQLFWIGNSEDGDFPNFHNNTSEVITVCIGLVKLTAQSYVFMADHCNSSHRFTCDNALEDYAPAVEALESAAPFNVEEEIEKAMNKPTSIRVPAVETHDNGVAKESQSTDTTNIATIVGPAVGGVILIAVVVAGLYCHMRIRKARAYRRSLFRYETKKANLHPKLNCNEITHLTIPEHDTSSHDDERSKPEPEQDREREHDDTYYDRRYEPLQRELVDACSRNLKIKNGLRDLSITEEQLNNLMNYDPLRKDSFQSSKSSVSVKYEKYDPDDEIEKGRTVHKIPPKKCNQSQNQASSYLKNVKTLDDLDQYENSNSLQMKKTQIVEDICKLQKDSENEFKKLEELDQYENYNLPPLKSLPTKTRPKKAGKRGTAGLTRAMARQDCYENHEI